MILFFMLRDHWQAMSYESVSDTGFASSISVDNTMKSILAYLVPVHQCSVTI